MSGKKRNSRTVECPVDSQGISAAREFRRNIEYIKAEKTERQIIKNFTKLVKKMVRKNNYNL